jgi:hypothetical protein
VTSPGITVASFSRSPDTTGRSSLASLIAILPVALVALAAGLSAEFLDFRALRVPILLLVLSGVIAGVRLVNIGRPGHRIAIALVSGAAAWGGAQLVYAVIHASRGRTFDFNAWPWEAQASQAAGLILAHAVFLGLPTGIAAAVVVEAWTWLRRRTSQAR